MAELCFRHGFPLLSTLDSISSFFPLQGLVTFLTRRLFLDNDLIRFDARRCGKEGGEFGNLPLHVGTARPTRSCISFALPQRDRDALVCTPVYQPKDSFETSLLPGFRQRFAIHLEPFFSLSWLILN